MLKLEQQTPNTKPKKLAQPNAPTVFKNKIAEQTTHQPKKKVSTHNKPYKSWLPSAVVSQSDTSRRKNPSIKGFIKERNGIFQEDVTLLKDGIAFRLDLPLELIDKLPNGFAKFTLVKTGKGLTYSISGKAYLRAILQRRLLKARSKRALKALRRKLAASRLNIRLTFKSQISIASQNPSGLPYRQENKFVDDGIEVIIIRYTGGYLTHVNSGFALSDAAAEKRRKWETKELLELRQMPAYLRTMRNTKFE